MDFTWHSQVPTASFPNHGCPPDWGAQWHAWLHHLGAACWWSWSGDLGSLWWSKPYGADRRYPWCHCEGVFPWDRLGSTSVFGSAGEGGPRWNLPFTNLWTLVYDARSGCTDTWTTAGASWTWRMASSGSLCFCKRMCLKQVKQGGHAHLEQPASARSWRTNALGNFPGFHRRFDQCRYGCTGQDTDLEWKLDEVGSKANGPADTRSSKSDVLVIINTAGLKEVVLLWVVGLATSRTTSPLWLPHWLPA